ncbi:MAG: hypothetical protein KGL39_11720 [Patescibacteria group bacterium]|nr:hypothetical protein [Patescibacteria group bacterium]
MAYTSAQIVTMATTIAKAPGYLSLAGEYLNLILNELWVINDFAFSRKKTYIDITQAQPTDSYGQPLGFNLPTDHERTLETYYIVNGAPREVVQLPIEQYDGLFQGVTGASFPEFICVDVSQTPHTALFYPLPPLATGVYMRYLPQQADIANPESSNTPPWFQFPIYLVTRLASELMRITDDSRQGQFSADAAGMLSKFLTMGEDDRENYVRQVKLDPRYFRGKYSQKPTKNEPL